MRIQVALNERCFVHVNGKPVRYLGPGRHWIFRPFAKVEVIRENTDALVACLRPELQELVPAVDLRVLSLSENERALVFRRGRPVLWLGVGEHLVWTVDRRTVKDAAVDVPRFVEKVRVETFDTSAIEAKPLRDDVKALVPASDYIETTAPENTVALRFVDGVLDAVLPPGRHAAWTIERKVTFTVIDLREKLLHVNGQEVMTKDRVTLRLNLSVSYRVVDPKRVATVARDPDDLLYLAAQFAAREAVATRTLDELLASREAVGGAIAPDVTKRAAEIGLEVVTFGVKDVVLPGEMKTLLNRVIEAQKEAEANVILRREETAAVRSMANTAKVLAENPILMRLKELEAYKELAGKVGQVHLVVGEGGMPKLNILSG
ncbi:MAG: slipin family protein [Deltaproteobacteria bacterium]|nr:slipin family protein [Deltaproteobacteria bacterium]